MNALKRNEQKNTKVKVALRVRPLINKEKIENSSICVQVFHETKQVIFQIFDVGSFKIC